MVALLCNEAVIQQLLGLQAMRQSYNVPDLSVPSTSGRDPISPHSSASGFDETWDLVDDGYTPFPANLPTNEGFDGYIRQASGALHLSETKDLWSKIGQVSRRVSARLKPEGCCYLASRQARVALCFPARWRTTHLSNACRHAHLTLCLRRCM